MPKLLSTTQSKFYLTPEEELQSALLNELQICGIQNQLADSVNDRLALDFDPLNPVVFAQNEAFLKGKIAVLTWLLDSNDDAINRLNDSEVHGI